MAEVEDVVVVDPDKCRFTPVDGVRTHSEVEVDDVDAVNLPQALVLIALCEILGRDFARGEEHALEKVVLVVVLYLNDVERAGGVLGEDVNPVLLRIRMLAVALALKQAVDLKVFVKQRADKALQHSEVGLVAQKTLERPVERDVCSFTVHSYAWFKIFAICPAVRLVTAEICSAVIP